LAYCELLLAHGKTDCWQVDEATAHAYEWLTRHRLLTRIEFFETLRQRRRLPAFAASTATLGTAEVDVPETLVWLLQTACAPTQLAAHLASVRRLCAGSQSSRHDATCKRILTLVDALAATHSKTTIGHACLQPLGVFRDCATCSVTAAAGSRPMRQGK
jgi:hypothetical protein